MMSEIPPYSELLSSDGLGGLDSSIALYRGTDLVPYEQAMGWMEARVASIIAGEQPEALWLLEHSPLYTAGTSANPDNLIQPDRFEVHKVGRGGEYTYHGPGQRVVYVMLDLNKRGRDVRAFVKQLENWIIATLASFEVSGEIRDGRVGVWVETGQDFLGRATEAKIAAIGIRVRKWVTFHGIAINVSPDLEHFSGIVPCGISEHGVTSLTALQKSVTMLGLDQALIDNAPFGRA